MDEKFKVEWLAALRGGKYRQGSGYLCRRDGDVEAFCCLGVALDLQGAEWAGWSHKASEFATRACKINDIPLDSNALAGELRGGFPMLSVTEIGVLMQMNDSGKTFPEIASYIEANL